MVYGEWLKIYYQITSTGRGKLKKEGKLRRIFDPRLWREGDRMEVLDYLGKYPGSPRNLEQIWKGLSGFMYPLTRKGVLKDVLSLKRKGLIKRVK